MSTSALLFIFKTLESNTSIDPDWRILEKYLYVYKQALDFSLV
jgi:hypothetical protein